MTKALAVKEESKIVEFDNSIFSQYAGAGAEEITQRDLKIPILKVVEAMGDNLKKNSSKYLPDAKPGDIVDTAINEVVGRSVVFLPVKFKKSFIEWKDNKIKERHDEEILAKCEWRSIDGQRKGNFRTDNGNEVSETLEFYGINLSSDGNPWVCVSMARGRINAAKTFISYLNRMLLPSGQKAPLFYKVWDLSTKEEVSNDRPYNTWEVRVNGLLEDREDAAFVLPQALDFLKVMNDGKAAAAEVDDDAAEQEECAM